MVAGNVVALPRGLFDPVRTLTANMALEMSYATGAHRSALFVSGLVLLILIGLLVVAARAGTGRGSPRRPGPMPVAVRTPEKVS
jgi:phosphate transport system permease protein